MIWLRWGLIQCALSVILGAFAAHILKDSLSDYSIKVFETAVRYQFFHGLALLFTFMFTQVYKIRLNFVLIGFAVGSLIFCGSLYGLALLKLKFLGAVTPIGGVLWIVSWSVFFYKTLALKDSKLAKP